MNRLRTCHRRSLLALAILVMSSNLALAAPPVIHLAPIQPRGPGWGQTAQYNAFVSWNGRPVKNVVVEFWFSGRKGIRTSSWFVRTNHEGRATFTATLPRAWAFYRPKTWADLNASCDQVGAFSIWRVKNK